MGTKCPECDTVNPADRGIADVQNAKKSLEGLKSE